MIKIKKYRCKNGEIVDIEDFNKTDPYIFVHYKGRRYREPISKIGTTLFPLQKKRLLSHKPNKLSVKIDSIVTLKNCSTNEILAVKICGAHAVHTYKRMGGSYYGNSTHTAYVCDDVEIIDGITNISTTSPMGKVLIGKRIGDIITVPIPDNNFDKFKIISLK